MMVVPIYLSDRDMAEWATVGVTSKQLARDLLAVGVDVQRAGQWISAGVQAGAISNWIAGGYDPGSVRFWTQHGVNTVDVRRLWEQNGWDTPERIDVHLREVAAWAAAGFQRGDMIRVATHLGFTAETVGEMAAVGVTGDSSMRGFLGVLAVLNGDTNGVSEWLVPDSGLPGWRAAIWGRAVYEYLGPKPGSKDWRWMIGFGLSYPDDRPDHGDPLRTAVKHLERAGTPMRRKDAARWIDAGVPVADIPAWVAAGVPLKWVERVRHELVSVDWERIFDHDVMLFDPAHLAQWVHTEWFRTLRKREQGKGVEVNSPIRFDRPDPSEMGRATDVLLRHTPEEVAAWADVGIEDWVSLRDVWETFTVTEAGQWIQDGFPLRALVRAARVGMTVEQFRRWVKAGVPAAAIPLWHEARSTQKAARAWHDQFTSVPWDDQDRAAWKMTPAAGWYLHGSGDDPDGRTWEDAGFSRRQAVVLTEGYPHVELLMKAYGTRKLTLTDVAALAGP